MNTLSDLNFFLENIDKVSMEKATVIVKYFASMGTTEQNILLSHPNFLAWCKTYREFNSNKELKFAKKALNWTLLGIAAIVFGGITLSLFSILAF